MKAILPLLGLLLIANLALAQGSAFTYQGRLDTPQGPANGLYDFRCQLYNAEQFGAIVSTTVTNSAVPVTNGLFVINLDFGTSVFNGQERWLLITVRTNNGLNFTAIVPRQRLSPTPYAVYSGTAANLAPGANQTFTGAVNFSPPSGAPFSVSSTTKVPNLNADWLDGLDSSAFVLKTGDTMSGNLAIANPASVNFGNSTRQMVNLWGSAYGIGVQSGTLYFRSDGTFANSGNFAWYRGGTHADAVFDPGTGGTALMLLSADGHLHVNSGGGAGISCVSAGAGGFAVSGQCTSPSGEVYGVRGQVISPDGSGVYGGNSTIGGIAVHGLHGGGTGSRTSAGVYGESTASAGNGVVGVADNGASAYGVWGRSSSGSGGVFDGAANAIWARSSSGFAGQFDGAVHIDFASPFNKPQLEVDDPSDTGFARIRLRTGSRPLWDVALGTTPGLLQTNSLRFFSEGNGDVMSLSTNGNLFVRVLTITGGADLAEPFEMSQREIAKGAVVVIDDRNPGKLKLSEYAYDTRVAGVISGAGGVNPGLTLQQNAKLDSGQQVALTGRVYVQADASFGSIAPGDMLTSSGTPGHAMKVSDHDRARGAILGKAMSALMEGKGLVLVLVSLQ